jgi:hypothetical protein
LFLANKQTPQRRQVWPGGFKADTALQRRTQWNFAPTIPIGNLISESMMISFDDSLQKRQVVAKAIF